MQILLAGALLAGGLGVVQLRAQTVLGDPRDAAKTFASNCSACHKSPQGLAKSGQVAGFLRQHYTTGAEMSAAMAAYLVSAGSAPASKKNAATAETAATHAKGKKGEQLAAQPPQEHPADAAKMAAQRGKQRMTKAPEPPPAARPAPVEEAKPSPAAEIKQAAANAVPPVTPAPAPMSSEPAPIVLDIPLPPMPDGPPPELSQSVFSSSPLP